MRRYLIPAGAFFLGGGLIAADYSTGDYYHYTYDAVGNRLTQVKSFGGQQSTDSYQYDIANRLLSVNEEPYTWDNNGNLLNDGVNRYAYDAANRLVPAGYNRSIVFSRLDGPRMGLKRNLFIPKGEDETK